MPKNSSWSQQTRTKISAFLKKSISLQNAWAQNNAPTQECAIASKLNSKIQNVGKENAMVESFGFVEMYLVSLTFWRTIKSKFVVINEVAVLVVGCA